MEPKPGRPGARHSRIPSAPGKTAPSASGHTRCNCHYQAMMQRVPVSHARNQADRQRSGRAPTATFPRLHTRRRCAGLIIKATGYVHSDCTQDHSMQTSPHPAVLPNHLCMYSRKRLQLAASQTYAQPDTCTATSRRCRPHWRP